MQQPALFDPEPISSRDIASPCPYSGLYNFHKYWGKKPAEPLNYLIQLLSEPNALVVDPFLGSGVSAREALLLHRRFIGIDINPVATRLSRLVVNPPCAKEIKKSLIAITKIAKDNIYDTYHSSDGRVATHYLWREQTIESVWFSEEGRRQRIEMAPLVEDIKLSESYNDYIPKMIRAPHFFANSRINASSHLTLKDMFTGRALHNIEILLSAIETLDKNVQEPLRLALTAAIGQMSKMVFAITSRGKMGGNTKKKIEVGSWVIGYWRPEQHFEINVWNIFERRVKKLIKSTLEAESNKIDVRFGDIGQVCAGEANCAILNSNALESLALISDNTVDLFITDPPHSDRIPYLELSELWNSILNEYSDFDSEIVVSNAKGRGKDDVQYGKSMLKFLEVVGQKLSSNGHLVLFFNAKSKDDWSFIDIFLNKAENVGLDYMGCFPLIYSALSVVQDNREGALQSDYGLVFSCKSVFGSSLAGIPGWSHHLPIPKD